MSKGILNTFAVVSATLLFLGWMNIPPDSTNTFELQNTSAPSSDFLSVGEELTYEVSWWWVKLGTIRTKVLSQQGNGEDKRYSPVAYIDSYSGIPFANLHAIFETTMDNKCFSDSFVAREQDSGRWKITRYRFDRMNNMLFVENSTAESEAGSDVRIEKIDTIAIESKSQDGLSLLFFARANVKSGRQYNVPTIIKSSKGNTILNFLGKRTNIKIDSTKYPVDVIEFDGNAEFTGIFGLNGPFEGWFSNDPAQIPIKAKMKVILGSINIELKKWQRTGWNPPQYILK